MSVQFASASLIAMLLATIRITAWVMIVPPFAMASLPRMVKFMLSVGLALAVTSTAQAHAPAAEIGPLVSSAVEQLVIGSALGFITRLLFSAIESAGSMIDLFGGFSLAFAYDPFSASTNSVFGKFYSLMTTTLIFATNAHLVIIQGFLRTFSTIPLNGSIDTSHLGSTLVHGMTGMFVAALQIAAPMIAVLFMADLALGLLSRISPQLNVFQLSFPLKIMLTLGLVGMGFALLPRIVIEMANNTAGMITHLGGG